MNIFLLLATVFFSSFTLAHNKVDYNRIFSDREGCFLVANLRTGKIVDEFNSVRCKTRFSPYSSFKIAAALMAFETGVFKNENQVIKWDGVRRGREEIDQDLTPFTFMSGSAKWVTEWIMPQVGNKAIGSFLNSFSYGNQDFSGGFKDAWVASSLKISAHEQVKFLSNFWNENLGISQRAIDLTKKIIFIKKLGNNAELYGKTGTGCLVGNTCLEHADKMIGWFVGVLKSGPDAHVFAGNASNLKPQGAPAGPRMRDSTVEILMQLGLASK